MFKKVLFSVTILSFLAFPALAQEEDLPEPGLLPDSPFYFLKSWTEDIGTFFVFDDAKKAERLAELAQKRIAEAKALAKKGKPEKAEIALERYEKHIEKSVERVERIKERNQERAAQIAEKIALQTENDFDILEDNLNEAPEKIRKAILELRESTTENQVKAIKVITEGKPERAVEIFSSAIEKRLERIRTEVDSSDEERTEEAVREYNKLDNLGQDISVMAKGIRVGETTVEDLVEKATSHHLEVLERVRNQVNEQTKEKIEEAIELRKEIREELNNNQSEKEQEREREVCAQVITFAKNERTGECKQFFTPCDVPDGWEKVDNCNRDKNEDENENENENKKEGIMERLRNLY